MRRFLCSDIPAAGAQVALDGPTSHHLLRVTGIAPGEQVELFDGQGVAARASLVEVREGLAVLSILEAVDPPTADRPLWLLPALVRPAAMETVIRMATELGVARITPLQTERVVARGDKSERWRRIVSASAAQCGRADVPQVDAPLTLEAALDLVGSGWRVQICVPGVDGSMADEGPLALLVGPEGGWTEEELALAVSGGVSPVGLGATTLRADTAAVVALAQALA